MNPRLLLEDAHPAPDLLRAVDEDVLPEDIAIQVRSHLESCRVCAQLRQDLLHPSLSEPSLSELTRLGKRVLPGLRPRRFQVRYIVAAAAIAALFVTGFWLGKRDTAGAPQPTGIARKAPSYRLPLQPAPLRLPLATAIILRGQQDDAAEKYLKELGAALEPYRAARYADAALQLKALGARYPRAVEPPLYLGVTLLLAGDFEAAIEPLQKAREIGGEALNNDIQWYLAIAHERTGAWTQALPLLQALCRAEGPYRDAACEGTRPR